MFQLIFIYSLPQHCPKTVFLAGAIFPRRWRHTIYGISASQIRGRKQDHIIALGCAKPGHSCHLLRVGCEYPAKFLSTHYKETTTVRGQAAYHGHPVDQNILLYACDDQFYGSV